MTQKLAEQSARRYPQGRQQALARSQAIFRQMTEGLVIFDAHGNLLDINPAALAVYGVPELKDVAKAPEVPRQGVDVLIVPWRAVNGGSHSIRTGLGLGWKAEP
jgi:PAS domain-containing protein